jgi:hypothetical protein
MPLVMMSTATPDVPPPRRIRTVEENIFGLWRKTAVLHGASPDEAASARGPIAARDVYFRFSSEYRIIFTLDKTGLAPPFPIQVPENRRRSGSSSRPGM